MVAEISKPSFERRLILETARNAVLCYLGLGGSKLSSAGTVVPTGVFVTIKESGKLRGCMGVLNGKLPLLQAVWEAARQAAFFDPRFPPLSPQEVDRCEFEVTVLDRMEALRLEDKENIDRVIVPGVHGVQVKSGSRSAILLPQVATEMGWGATELLDAVCVKAGLSPGAWRREPIQVYRFTATIIE
ncbi:MAG: AmmeMemoRadiSam system protein A [Thermoprotei archaeon]